MSDQDKTQTDPGTQAGWASLAEQHVVTVAFHDDPAHIGRRVEIREGREVVIGRGNLTFGGGTLDDSRLSRKHASLAARKHDLVLRDLGSHNGTTVDGVSVAADEGVPLEPGAIIGVGRLLLLYHRALPLKQVPQHPRLKGVGARLATLLDDISRVASRPLPVLIQGETGVGKELVAEAIHAASGVEGELVAMNCGAVPDGVVHSELFGHERGAFSGADTARRGLVAAAAGGSLFLDEIGDASPALQVSLLRLLEQREYRAVGSDVVQTTDTRFITATHVPLETAVAAGRFRRDLCARVQRAVIHVPPLRERREDIIPIALHLLQAQDPELRIHRSLALALLQYDWPMNVRELAAVLDQAIAEMREPPRLRMSASLAARLGIDASAATSGSSRAASGVGSSGHAHAGGAGAGSAGGGVDRPEPAELVRRFLACGGRVKDLAEALGVSRNTLYRWFKEDGIDPNELRTKL